ncbi:MAG: hypothetical protein AAF604_03990 [Acidobacteriota bacterium]
MIALLHAGATVAMAGLIWFVQIVHYPLFGAVPAEASRRYAVEHQRRTGWVVGPLMLLELGTAIALVVAAPGDPLHWLGAGLLALIWGSTAVVQIPLHRQLILGHDRATVDRLVTSNWLRTLAWSLRAPLALSFL